MRIPITKKYTLRVTFAPLLLSLAWVAVAAFPFAALWNRTFVPLTHVEAIGYLRAVNLLLLWLLLYSVGRGVTVNPITRDDE